MWCSRIEINEKEMGDHMDLMSMVAYEPGVLKVKRVLSHYTRSEIYLR